MSCPHCQQAFRERDDAQSRMHKASSAAGKRVAELDWALGQIRRYCDRKMWDGCGTSKRLSMFIAGFLADPGVVFTMRADTLAELLNDSADVDQVSRELEENK